MKVIRRLEDLAPEYPSPIITIGNFDGIHLGHKQLILDLAQRAAKIGGTAAVVTFYPHPLQVLAPNNAPLQIQTLEQKLATIESLGIALAAVIPFDMQLARLTARDFAVKLVWEKLHPREIYVGPNFAFGNRRQGSFNLLKEIGEEKGFMVGKIHQVQFRGNRVSSTSVRQALISGQVGFARRLLDRPFALDGSVIHGTAVGKSFGFPTANLQTSNELIPRRGVYATMLNVEGIRHKGVTNIGVRPTIAGEDESAPQTIETFVFDYDRDLYGRQVSLDFLVRIRDELKFAGKDALIAQICRDADKARRFFRWLEKTEPKCFSQ